jgi:hypothetical protein
MKTQPARHFFVPRLSHRWWPTPQFQENRAAAGAAGPRAAPVEGYFQWWRDAERIKSALAIAVVHALTGHLTIGVETMLRLTDTVFLERVIAVFPDAIPRPTTADANLNRKKKGPPGGGP